MTELEFPKGQYHYRQYTELTIVFLLDCYILYSALLWFLFFFFKKEVVVKFGCFVVFWWGGGALVVFWVFLAALVLHFCAWAFSSCSKQGLQGAQASVVVVHRLNCLTTCGIFPDQGWNPCPLNWQEDSLPLDHQGSPDSIFKKRVSWLLSPSF